MNEKKDINLSSAHFSDEETVEKTLFSKTIFDGKVIHLHLDDIILPDGKIGFREYCTHNGAVCVIPITDDNEVICVRQYRYAIRQHLLEIPAGKLDSPDENPDEAVRRELREETGATSDDVTFLGLYYGSPALIDEKIYMYLAEDISFVERSLDEDEFLDVEYVHISELLKMVMSGEIKDAKTQTAILKTVMLRGLLN